MKRLVTTFLIVASMALLSAMTAMAGSSSTGGGKACNTPESVMLQKLFPSMASSSVSTANLLADCGACEQQMRQIRSQFWSPGPPPSGNWCSGQRSAVLYCFNNCTPCQICIDWRDEYNQLCGGGGGEGFENTCGLTYDDYYTNPCDCNPYDPLCTTPVIIDTAGDGYRLTSVSNGVRFDLRADSAPLLTSWTEANSDDGWLALDRNGNGLIDNGAELFGNFTPQSATIERNGFRALADYDKRVAGGNGDNFITAADSVFISLRVWRDLNHNGTSEPAELVTLSSIGIEVIDLDYKATRRRDSHGNLFRYRAKLNGSRSAWDVFLIHE